MKLFFKSKKNITNNTVLPKHIGIIMDGNGRWAKKRGLPRKMGHSAGAQTFKTIVRYCSDIGIQYLTVYAFSTENWKRPEDELNSLMNLFESYFREALRDFKDENIKVCFLGDTSHFSDTLQSLINEVRENSKDNDGMVLNIALNYGSRAEILRAVKNVGKKINDGDMCVSDLTEDTFSQFLYTSGQPDVDLIIRPSGEHRISNFLLWQCAYAEFVFMDKLWPDFKCKDLDLALKIFSQRNRRFGGV